MQVYRPASEVVREGNIRDVDVLVLELVVDTGGMLILLALGSPVFLVQATTNGRPGPADTVQFNILSSPGLAIEVSITTTGALGIAV